MHIFERIKRAAAILASQDGGLAFHDAFNEPTGHIKYDVRRSGKIIERVDENNLIVIASQPIHANLLGGNFTGFNLTQFGVGTNATAPTFGNGSLTQPYYNALTGISYPASNQVQFAFGMGGGDAPAFGMAISEFGMLTPTGLLYSRKTRSTPLNFASDIAFSGTWTISF